MQWVQARLLLLPAKVNTKPGTRKAKRPGKKKKDDPAVEHEDLDEEEEQQPHTQEVEDAAGQSPPPHLAQNMKLDFLYEQLLRFCWSLVPTSLQPSPDSPPQQHQMQSLFLCHTSSSTLNPSGGLSLTEATDAHSPGLLPFPQ